MNITYDGDQHTGTIARSVEQAEDFKEFSPHYGIHSFTRYKQFTDIASLPNTATSVISNWIEMDLLECKENEGVV